MTRAQQTTRFEEAQGKGERSLLIDLAGWTRAVVAAWTPGTVKIPKASKDKLDRILIANYNRIGSVELGLDWQKWKQEDEEVLDEVMAAIAAVLVVGFARRQRLASRSINKTLTTMMRRANTTARDASTTAREFNRIAKVDLSRRMVNHRMVIAISESGWTAGLAHKTAVLEVTDPLQDTVAQIIKAIEADDINLARRLSRQSMKLARLPTSVSQGKLLQTISDARDQLVTPISQGRIITQLRNRSELLDKQRKQWETVGDSLVRDSHVAANGQQRDIEEPFVLAGGRMQQPRDGSLGASLGEIVNCRCLAFYL